MSIVTQELLDRMAREFGVDGASEYFSELFIDAVNDVSHDLEWFDAVDEITDVQTDIDCDAEYYPAYRDGVRLHMSRSGEWNRSPKGDLEGDYARSQAQALAAYFADNAPTVRHPQT